MPISNAMKITVMRIRCARVRRISPKTPNETANTSRHKGTVKPSSVSTFHPSLPGVACPPEADLPHNHDETSAVLMLIQTSFLGRPSSASAQLEGMPDLQKPG